MMPTFQRRTILAGSGALAAAAAAFAGEPG